MTTAQQLGAIQQVPLRQVWEHEAANFTPWLYENIDLLGKALGLDLEATEQEASVGTFSLDILAQEVGTNRAVIIENQFGATDHDHLGKLLTYAAGFQAGVIVWIAEDFRDEHRAALDYLNASTGEDKQFFGVAMELWKIDNSRPAPYFSLVAFPNDWSKPKRQSIPSDKQNTNRKFRRGLIDKMEQNNVSYIGRVDNTSSYLVLERPIDGVQGVRYSVIWHQGKPGINLIIESKERDWNEQLFQRLERDKEAIETALAVESDESTRWEPQWRKTGARFAIYREGDVYEEQETWDDYQEWMIAKFQRFREILSPRLTE